MGLKANYFKFNPFKQYNLVIFKIAINFAITPYTKKNAYRANKITLSLLNTSNNIFTFFALSIKTPELL